MGGETRVRTPLTAEVDQHRFDVIPGGHARMRHILSLIASATSRIDMIFYIFAADTAGHQILAALIEAAGRGVKITAVIDSFGSSDTPDSFFEPLRTAGGCVTFFSRRWRSSYLIRNHQKLLLIDNRVAMTGGFNIAHPYLTDDDPDRWCDLGIIVTGPSVARLVQWFAAIDAYTRLHDGKLLRLRRLVRDWPVDDMPVSWVIGGPTERLSPWARRLRSDVKPTSRLAMAIAYFSPAQGLLRLIGRVAKGGCVELILPARSDNGATIGASRLLYGYLLGKGAQIAEYQPSRLHMKLIIVDDIVYLGSPNFDFRSLFLNVELSLRIDDAAFAAQMRDLMATMQADSELIDAAAHKRRASPLTRLRWMLAWFVVSTVDYTVARRLNFGLDKRR